MPPSRRQHLADASRNALPVMCYTVNDPAQAAALFACGVSGLFTDALDVFRDETFAYPSLHLPG